MDIDILPNIVDIHILRFSFFKNIYYQELISIYTKYQSN